MPSIQTAAALRAVLGVSISLFDDTYLNNVIDTAEAVILPQLVSGAEAITRYKLKDNVAYFTTRREHDFILGQSVIVAGLPAPFSATFTVLTPLSNIGGQHTFTVSLVAADVPERKVEPTGTATLSGYDAATLYASNAAVKAAVLELSVQVFRTRVAPDAGSQGADFTGFAMGRSLFSKIKGLLGNEIDTDGLAQ
jgi:hypothetical protein